MRKYLLGMAATAVAVLGFTASAQAVDLFQVEANPGGTKLFMDSAKDSSSSNGTVVSNDDVTISVFGNANFASGFSTIKPSGDINLLTLIFTPTDPNAFNSFSFRGQDEEADQVINVIIQDNQGNAPQTITFTEDKANQDFDRQGIIAALDGETIKWVELSNSGGFKEAKQFEFNLVGQTGGVPEPATWLMMIAGFGLVGGMMRMTGKSFNLIKA
jgi:hypothetical protein